MRPSDALHAHRPEIRRIVTAHRATNARVFGSVSRGEDVDGSDVDLLIDPKANTTLFDIVAIRYELLKLLGIRVDVLTPQALPERFHAKVLAEAVPA